MSDILMRRRFRKSNKNNALFSKHNSKLIYDLDSCVPRQENKKNDLLYVNREKSFIPKARFLFKKTMGKIKINKILFDN